MPDLVDLKRTDAEKRDQVKHYDGDVNDVADYSYGLNISLDNEHLEKLGINPTDFDAGKPVRVVALGIIESMSVSTFNGNPRKTMSIQLQKMSVEQEKEATDMVSAMYGSNT